MTNQDIELELVYQMDRILITSKEVLFYEQTL